MLSCVTLAFMATVPLTLALLAGAVIFTCAYEGTVREISRINATPIVNVRLPALLGRPVHPIRMTTPLSLRTTQPGRGSTTLNAPGMPTRNQIQEFEEEEIDGREN